jgi:hypothetical protein
LCDNRARTGSFHRATKHNTLQMLYCTLPQRAAHRPHLRSHQQCDRGCTRLAEDGCQGRQGCLHVMRVPVPPLVTKQ